MNIRSRVKRGLIWFYSFGKPKKKVLFDSFGGTQYSADPRAISEKMHELYPEYELVWFIKKHNRKSLEGFIPEYVRVVEENLDFIKELASSCAYVTTEPLTRSFYKRKSQFVVQTWHGDRGFKKALYQAAESTGKVRDKIYDDEYTDVCISGSNFGNDFYRHSFKYSGKIVQEGMPKNDKLINRSDEEALKIREKLHIPINYKILLYAPTFRGNSINEQNAQIDINRTLNVLERKGEKWICLLRAHKYSKEIVYKGAHNKIIDVSYYPDMADLLLITDMLMTDYSSVAGDFALLKKPIILIANDEEDYRKSSRQLRMNLNDVGFVISHNQAELEQLITCLKDEDYALACEKALQFYCTTETGRASVLICNMINENYYDKINRS